MQDVGLADLIRRMAPTLPVHASTQMTQTEPRGIALLRSLGVRRVILARELSLDEIERVAGATDMELEVFVHGAICISYSGQCLASESLFGRSANRGECAQACRLPYRLVVDGEAVPPGGPADVPYPLSPKDLFACDRIPDLVRLGVAAFKIEGRLKDAVYVAATTRLYRAAVDAAVAGRPFAPSPEQRADLAQSFSRGFTPGFLGGTDHQGLIEGRSPKGRGVPVGTVVGKTSRGIVVALTGAAALKPGDGVVFDAGRAEPREQGGRVYSVEPAGRRTRAGRAAERRFELTFGRGDIDLGAVAVGSVIRKTDDPTVRRRLEAGFRRDVVPNREPLSIRVRAAAQEPLRIAVSDARGNHVEVASSEPLGPADRHPLTVDLLREQLGRLGDSPFELASIELTGPEGPTSALPVMAPRSVLNALRREAVRLLLTRRAEACRHAIVEPEALAAERARIGMHPTSVGDHPPSVAILVRRREQLDTVCAWVAAGGPPPALVWCDLAEPGAIAGAVAATRSAGLPVGLATPRILGPMPHECSAETEHRTSAPLSCERCGIGVRVREGHGRHGRGTRVGREPIGWANAPNACDVGLLRCIADARPDAVLIRNLGSLAFFRRHLPDVPRIGDASLNVANELSAARLIEAGLERVTPAYDLDPPQVQALLAHASPAWLDVVVYQHVPMFHMRHCLYAARLSTGRSCGDCGRPCDRHELRLRDRVGVDHPVVVDAAGRNTVFHGTPQSSLDRIPALRRLGVRHFRIELLDETPAETRRLLEQVASGA